jgi:hypothetical protein
MFEWKQPNLIKYFKEQARNTMISMSDSRR